MSYSSYSTMVRELIALRDAGASVYSVHYACESFYKQPSEPAAISAIAFAAVFASPAETYSVMDRQEDAERFVLDSFYNFLRENPDARLIHWNMASPDFGFHAIANRYVRICGKEPPTKHPAGLLIDLDELIGLGHGRNYAEHPKLVNIAKLNDFRIHYFLSGKEEAELFEKKDHARIRRSVTEKATVLYCAF